MSFMTQRTQEQARRTAAPAVRLSFEQSEFDARIAKTRQAMQTAGVDLLIVSDSVILEQAYIALTSAEQEIARRINVTLYTSEEFRQRREQGNPFIAKVLAGEHWLLMGKTDEPAATR